MESYQVVMTRNATQDLRDISSYIANVLKEPVIAKRLVEKIKLAVMCLDQLPMRHNLVSDEYLASMGFRKIMIDNYLIFYIVSEKDKTVTVVRILYGKRDWIHLL
jgi:addiction module RelE/StbE family toxin